MPFIRSFSIKTDKQHPFPYSIPAVRFAKEIALGSAVTVFVGDNGCGKSTLLEALAFALNLPLIGGYISEAAEGFEAARLLKPYLHLRTSRNTLRGFFFRAEDFSDFLKAVERENARNERYLDELRGEVDPSVIARMKETMNQSLQKTRHVYGDNLQAYSHGEGYLKILQTRIQGKGVYLLDEPEAALSPLKQLSLMALILEAVKGGNMQFILATHSPILMGLPGALLYEIQDDGMRPVAFEDTEHYRITKTFLGNPEYYLRHL